MVKLVVFIACVLATWIDPMLPAYHLDANGLFNYIYKYSTCKHLLTINTY